GVQVSEEVLQLGVRLERVRLGQLVYGRDRADALTPGQLLGRQVFLGPLRPVLWVHRHRDHLRVHRRMHVEPWGTNWGTTVAVAAGLRGLPATESLTRAGASAYVATVRSASGRRSRGSKDSQCALPVADLLTGRPSQGPPEREPPSAVEEFARD